MPNVYDRAIGLLYHDESYRNVHPAIDNIISLKFRGDRQAFAHWFYQTFSHDNYISQNSKPALNSTHFVNGRILTVGEASVLYHAQLRVIMHNAYHVPLDKYPKSLLKRLGTREFDPIANLEGLETMKPDTWVITHVSGVRRVNMLDVKYIELALRYGVNGMAFIRKVFSKYIAKHYKDVIRTYYDY